MFRFPRPPRSLAGQLFAMQVLLVAVVVAGCAVFAYATARGQAEEAARRQAGAVARAVADSPSVHEAVRAAGRGGSPSAALQPYAERVRVDSGVDFVTIMAPDLCRLHINEPPIPNGMGVLGCVFFGVFVVGGVCCCG
ncbi:hypothetical protein ACFXA3_41825, partial [Streptomyces sp. NPDC059456]